MTGEMHNIVVALKGVAGKLAGAVKKAASKLASRVKKTEKNAGRTPNGEAAEATDVAPSGNEGIVGKFTGIVKKTARRTDGVLDGVTGKVAGIAPSGNKKIMAVAILAIAAVLIIAVTAVVVLDNGGGSQAKGMLDDEAAEGSLGLGARITYTVGGSGEVDVTVVGQSQGYYLVNVSSISFAVGGSAEYQMFHKATGQLRFAFNGGEKVKTVDGAEKTLTEWTLSTSDGTTWKFFSSGDDGIPYIIEAENTSKTTAVFKAKYTTPATSYVPPSGMDAFFKYSITGSNGPNNLDGYGGDLYYGMAAAGSGGKWILKLIDASFNSDGKGNGGGKYRTVEYLEGNSPQDKISAEYLAGLANEGTETVSTADGDKDCTVYEGKVGDATIRTHEAGKVYRSYVKNDDGTYFSIVLKDYLSK
ncbi:MAG: hypothetical protein LBS92_06555 [Candidatus Methanoplasma sp.]|jgi:hypothetical protein|nr:hypothetical protein [Candidatus Methanoplasma sp.]